MGGCVYMSVAFMCSMCGVCLYVLMCVWYIHWTCGLCAVYVGERKEWVLCAYVGRFVVCVCVCVACTLVCSYKGVWCMACKGKQNM